jgi:OOP family OmpA-OmpF porin
MNKKALIAVLGVSAAAFALPAAAQGMSAVYIGGGLGQSKFKGACDGVSGTGVSCDDKDTSFKIFGGYQLNRNFAGELGYTDLGKAKASGPGGSTELSATAWELSAVGLFPVMDALSIFGRLGGYWGEGKLSGSGASGSKTTTNLTFGLGLQYDFTKNLGVRGEWQRYSKVKVKDDASGTEDSGDIDVLGISVLYRFQ